MSRARVLVAMVISLGLCSIGCNWIKGLGVLFAPRQIQKAEFQLTHQRLAILIEAARPGQSNPVFAEALHAELARMFADNGISTNVVPLRELLAVRRDNPDYSRWSLQKIGRAVNADQVLYVRLENLRIRLTSEHPLVEPAVALRMKVIGTSEAAETARLWPGREERRGREISHARAARMANNREGIDAEAVALAKEVAYYVAMPFYDVDLEENPPRIP